MTDEMSLAVSLLGVGMITVALVLSLVVGLGKLLIRLINLFPEPPSQEPLKNASFMPSDSTTLAAVTAAVAHMTSGKGIITKIEKQK